MALRYAYVDPVSGNDGTGAGNAVAATAATTPYQTLAAAMAANTQNLSTGSSIFRCLAGVDTITADLPLNGTSFPGSSDTNPLIIEGIGTGLHDGTVATAVGYTLRSNTTGLRVLTQDNVCLVTRNFRVLQTDDGDLYQHINSATSWLCDSMVLRTNNGSVFRPAGNNATNQRTRIINTMAVSAAERVIRGGASNDGYLTIEHCTFVGNHGTLGAIELGGENGHTLQWNYVANVGAGPAYASTGTHTRNKNASDDTSGDATYQSIAYATGSGVRVTSTTSGSENFDIGSASSLRDLATDSGYTVDILGRPRSTPDIGAFEYQAPSVGQPTDERIQPIEVGRDTLAIFRKATRLISLPAWKRQQKGGLLVPAWV